MFVFLEENPDYSLLLVCIKTMTLMGEFVLNGCLHYTIMKNKFTFGYLIHSLFCVYLHSVDISERVASLGVGAITIQSSAVDKSSFKETLMDCLNAE